MSEQAALDKGVRRKPLQRQDRKVFIDACVSILIALAVLALVGMVLMGLLAASQGGLQ